MQPVRMISTRRKEPVGRGLSYPLGAEALSRALAGLPEFESLLLDFGAKRTHPTRAVRPYDSPRARMPVLEVEYRNSTGEIAVGYAKPGLAARETSIRVVAIPSAVAAQVRELLASDGLPRARAWLDAPRTDTWRNGSHALRVDCDPVPKGLVFEER